jgi:predicted Zn-dependent protease with MMP-like domain
MSILLRRGGADKEIRDGATGPPVADDPRSRSPAAMPVPRSSKAFFALVERAIAGLPPRFRSRLDNVTLEVRSWPPRRVLREMGMADDESLYGLYEGTPMTERGPDSEPLYPARITLYQGPLEADFEEPEEIVRQIQITVLHEIGHHFGLADGEMELLEE